MDFESFMPLLESVNQWAVQGKRRTAGYRELSQKLGYRSERTVGMIRNGRRAPSLEFAQRLGKVMGLTPTEQNYLDLLAKAERRSASPQDRARHHQAIRELKHTAAPKVILTENDLNYIAHWYAMPIKQMLTEENFDANPETISRRLRGKVAPKEVQRAIDQMERIGVVEKNPDGPGYRVLKKNITTTRDVPVAAIRLHHAEQLARGREALREIPVDEREFVSLTLKFDPKRMSEAKGIIRQFVNDFDERFASESSREVFQVSIQCFPHTDGGKNG